MDKSQPKKDPTFLPYVYELTKGLGLIESLQSSLTQIDELDKGQLKRIGLRAYADGKWSIHKIFQHLIDWERIWCFRAIMFARAEGTIPEAHDQEIMGANSNADELTLDHLIKEISLTRQSSIMLFESFNEKILETNCEFFEYQMPLSAIGFTIAAHQIHHVNVIKEKYLPLDG